MSFEYMPELKLPIAYFVSLGEMGVIVAVRTEAIAPTGRYEPLTCRSFDKNVESVMVKIRVVDCRILDDRSWDIPAGDHGEPHNTRRPEAPAAQIRLLLPCVAQTKHLCQQAVTSALGR